MTPPTSHFTRPRHTPPAEEPGRRTDVLLANALVAHLALAIALAPLHDTWRAAVGVGLPASLGVSWMATARPGAARTRITVAGALMAYSALFVHQTHGSLPAHLHAFVALAALVSYRDWRVTAGGAATIACHALLLVALPDALAPAWLTDAAGGVGSAVGHAVALAVAAGVLGWLTRELRRADDETRRLIRAAERLARGDLGVEGVADEMPPAAARAFEAVRALERETCALAERMRAGARAGADGGPAPLPGAYGEILARLDYAASEAAQTSARPPALRLTAAAGREASRLGRRRTWIPASTRTTVLK